MYYPFPMLEWILDPATSKERRPLTARDVIVLRQLVRKLLTRFDQDKRAIRREQVLGLLMAGAIPVIGHLVLGWPLILVAVVISADAMVQVIIDEIRLWKFPRNTHAARVFAAQVEIAGTVIDQLISRAGQVQTKLWKVSSDWHLQYVRILLAVPLFVLIGLIPDLLAEPGWMAIITALILPAVIRIAAVFAEFHSKPPTEDIDLRYLPGAPLAMILILLCAVSGGIGYVIVELTPIDQHWRGPVVLMCCLACWGYVTVGWLRILAKTRKKFQQFLELDQNCWRIRLQPAYRDTQAGRDIFLRQTILRNSIWPPSWADLTEPIDHKAPET